MAKINAKLAAICTTAVAAVYAAGYWTTIDQAPVQPAIQLNTSSAVAQTDSQNQGLFKDGTFSGVGSNRRGYIQVSVTLSNQHITDVQITDFRMHYSIRDVVDMPQEVVQNQSPYVRNVSGATYSARAFQDAVLNALNQAQGQS